MDNQEKSTRRKRAKKPSQADYDNYVANVSNGLNPPSQAKRRRKKKPDADAYDQFLQESEPEAASHPLHANEDVVQLEMDIEEEKPAKKPAQKKKEPTGAALHANEDALQLEREMRQEKKHRPAKAAKPKQESAEDYDAYLLKAETAEELPPETPRKRKKNGGRRKNRRKKQMAVAYIVTMVAILGVFAVVGVRQVQQYQRYQMMREVVEDQRFYEGSVVDGVDVSGMTLEEARTYFENSVEPAYRNRSVSLTTGEMFTAEQLGYTSNYYTVLSTAWSSGRNGTLEERYDAIINGEHTAQTYAVTRTFYTEDAVQAAAASVASHVNQEAEEPQISGFDPETLKFTLDDGQPGYELDQERLVSDILYVMANGGGDIEPIINTVAVEYDADELRAGYGRISYISTDASTSSNNRLTNLDIACTTINGYRLEPGEQFSFNEILGKRTPDKGYKEAPVYGSDGMDYGGGICQVGSTLFNAAVMADMDIVERKPHSRPVAYLPKGQDCAINWGTQDLKFVNNTGSPVYIVTILTDDKQVECAVYGKLPEDGHTVKITSSTYKTLGFETIYQLDTRLAPGTQEIERKGRKGYKAVAYKVVLDKDGNEISNEVLCYSTYNKQDQIVKYNP